MCVNLLLNIVHNIFFNFQESLAELHEKVDKIQEQVSKGPSIPLKEKVVAVDAQETLKNDFKLPSTALNQVSLSINSYMCNYATLQLLTFSFNVNF